MTHTRTHVFVEFASPFLVCATCRQTVTGFHDQDRCGCRDGWWNEPCEHPVGSDSVCPSWSPVDGCCCQEHLGHVPHAKQAGASEHEYDPMPPQEQGEHPPCRVCGRPFSEHAKASEQGESRG